MTTRNTNVIAQASPKPPSGGAVPPSALLQKADRSCSMLLECLAEARDCIEVRSARGQRRCILMPGVKGRPPCLLCLSER